MELKSFAAFGKYRGRGANRLPLALLAALLLAACVPANAIRVHRGPTSHSAQKPKKSSKRIKKSFPKGQRQIDPGRAAEIQTALIKAGYLSGAPTGQWDSQTTAALQKLQADNGWQTKITPDSRALIKLGLGPDNSPSSAGAATSSLQGASDTPGASGTLTASKATNRALAVN